MFLGNIKIIEGKNMFCLTNNLWRNIESKSKRGWKVFKIEINKGNTKAKIFYEKTI